MKAQWSLKTGYSNAHLKNLSQHDQRDLTGSNRPLFFTGIQQNPTYENIKVTVLASDQNRLCQPAEKQDPQVGGKPGSRGRPRSDKDVDITTEGRYKHGQCGSGCERLHECDGNKKQDTYVSEPHESSR